MHGRYDPHWGLHGATGATRHMSTRLQRHFWEAMAAASQRAISSAQIKSSSLDGCRGADG